MRRNQPFAQLDILNENTLAFSSSYDVELVSLLKDRVPYASRRWNREAKVWEIAAKYGDVVRDLVLETLQLNIRVPTITFAKDKLVTKLIGLRYLGTPKDRGTDEPIAYGWADNSWSVLFPLSVLRNWFEPNGGDTPPNEAPSLYGMLGIKRAVTAIELKRAYRRVALQYHPDHNKEPDATEQFQRIQYAYETLKNSVTRQRYDAGLRLAATVSTTEQPRLQGQWRSPLRCGLVMVEGKEQVGRLVVSRILRWDDIVNREGRILITCWPIDENGKFDDKPIEVWVLK